MLEWEWECPVCHNGDIEEDDCFDTDHSKDEIIEYYVGSFQWQRHYKFAYMTNFIKD